METHTRKMPYQCDQCHLTFSLQSSYNAHRWQLLISFSPLYIILNTIYYFVTEKLIYKMKSQHKKKVQNLNCIITAKPVVNALLQMGLWRPTNYIFMKSTQKKCRVTCVESHLEHGNCWSNTKSGSTVSVPGLLVRHVDSALVTTIIWRGTRSFTRMSSTTAPCAAGGSNERMV